MEFCSKQNRCLCNLWCNILGHCKICVCTHISVKMDIGKGKKERGRKKIRILNEGRLVVDKIKKNTKVNMERKRGKGWNQKEKK